ncbi:MAG: NADPH-dependent FMN reductase [Candidatus Nanohaloarchaea archaeon]
MKFLVLVGTVREGRKSVHAAREVCRAFSSRDHETRLFDLKEHDMPFLKNRRHRADDPDPEVEEFGQAVEDSDAIVIVSPEYNHSIPGVLKNALDHLYPEYDDMPFSYVTVSGGGFGGVRSQSHLHDVTLALGGHPGPDLAVSNVSDVFSEDGKLLDEDYRERIDGFVERSGRHAEKFR